jgi:hypothetical protein
MQTSTTYFPNRRLCAMPCCCYPEACCSQHGTLIRTRKIENSIVQFNKFNFHCDCEVAKLSLLPFLRSLFPPSFYIDSLLTLHSAKRELKVESDGM